MSLVAFHLSSVPVDDRPAFIDELALNSSVPFRAGARDSRRPVDIDHASAYLGDLEVVKTRFENWEGFRSARQARDSSEPRVIISAGADLQIEAGDAQLPRGSQTLVAYWSVSPWRVSTGVSGTSHIALTVPLAMLGLPYVLVRDQMGRDLGSSPFGRVIAAHIASLTSLGDVAPAQSAALVSPTIDLVRLTLAAAAGDEFAGREPLARTLGLRVLEVLRARAGDAQLTMQSVADELGVSRRSVFRALEQLGVSAEEWLREERLIRAAALMQVGVAHLAVGAVARQCGFADHSSFSRAFRRRFGCSPSEWTTLSEAERSGLAKRLVRSPLDAQDQP
ncbi:helix-turn-helix transcriptional regulator [Microbacterium hominis]|uniref:Helix-turn-helix transcriptional regulator n=1 Tax=Microbacterium hominis TaxID=162426 RepID=A0A7D4Q7E8_9MICO|nr:helix-turn-helix transcriptional regulator [Microbacterium hominis]QKJ18959.1 helix-turn-helix transcriptional regulator [Microbacterium hominis]